MSNNQDVVLQELSNQRSLQLSVLNFLDTKSGILIAVDTAIILFLLNDFEGSYLGIVIPFGCFLLSLGLSFLAIWPRKYKFNPSPQALVTDYLFRKPNDKKSEASLQIISDMNEAYKFNERSVQSKRKGFKFGLIFFTIGVVFYVSFQLLGGFTMENDNQGNNVDGADSSQAIEEPVNQLPTPNPAAENIQTFSDNRPIKTKDSDK